MTKAISLLLKACLIIYFSSSIIALYSWYTGSDAYTLFAYLGLFCSVLFTAFMIGEVMASENAGFATKFIWIVSFIIFQVYAAMAYYFADRKTIYPAQQ